MFGSRISSTVPAIIFSALIVLFDIACGPTAQAQPVHTGDRILSTIRIEDDTEALRQLNLIFREIGPDHESSHLVRYLRVLRLQRTEPSPSSAYFEDIEALIRSRVYGAAFLVPSAMSIEGIGAKRRQTVRAAALDLLSANAVVESWIVPMTVRVLLGNPTGQNEVTNWMSLYMLRASRAVLGESPTTNLLMLADGDFGQDDIRTICRRIAASGPIDAVTKCKASTDNGQSAAELAARLRNEYVVLIEATVRNFGQDLTTLACGEEPARRLPDLICTDVLSAVLSVCVFRLDGDSSSHSNGPFVCNDKDIAAIRQANEELLSFLGNWRLSAK